MAVVLRQLPRGLEICVLAFGLGKIGYSGLCQQMNPEISATFIRADFFAPLVLRIPDDYY